MAESFPTLNALFLDGRGTEADFDKLKAGLLKRCNDADPATLKRDLLQMIQQDFAENGHTSICINGKLWEFVSDQPGVPYANWSDNPPADWIDHASVGIDVSDVMKAIS